MIANSFPDFSLADHDLDAPCPLTRWPNEILLSRDMRLDWPEHSAPLSVAAVTGGSAMFGFADGTIALDPALYMIIDEGDRFECAIDSPHPVESLHLFLMPGFAERAHAALVGSSNSLLDSDPTATLRPIHFRQKLHRHDDRLTPILVEIVRVVREESYTSGWHDEIFHRIADALLRTHCAIEQQVARLPALKSSTREEMIRRLRRSLDLIHSAYATPLTLEQMASAAFMSPWHFHRAFRAAYGRTPHRYLTALRLERACMLLRSSDLAIADVGRQVGFDRPSTFTELFGQHLGISPSLFRAGSGPVLHRPFDSLP